MEPVRNNVFDYVNEFYTQDPEWNRILPRSTVELFLRKESWAGKDNWRLMQLWEHILEFVLYCGHAETMPGDMTVDDCIQCVGWCARNIGEFEPTEAKVRDFMDTMVQFYDHMKGTKTVTHVGGMAAAQRKLLAEGQEFPLGKDGFFTGAFERFNRQGIPDLGSKIFIDIGDTMMQITDMLEGEYVQKLYPLDFKRAHHMYDSTSGDMLGAANEEEVQHAFSDYFCFDYKLLATGKPLIEDLADKINTDASGVYSHLYRQVMKELAKAKLLLFQVKKYLGGGAYSVIDVLRNESLVLMLPMDENADTENILFCGHSFCDDSMIVNFVRGTLMMPDQLKKMLDMLKRAKRYYAVRQGGQCSWDDFIANNQLLVRNLPMLIINKVPLVEDIGATIIGYQPAVLDEDDFVKPILPQLFPSNMFTAKDKELALQIWADVQATETPEEEEKEEDPTVLAIAVSRIFINLCGVYGFKDPEPIDDEMRQMQVDVKRITKEIVELLDIKKFDPRYVNEEGLFMMHIAEIRERENAL